MSRTGNVIKNTLYGVAGKVISLFLSFFSRTVFISCLGSAYLGINGLYTEILSVLSFAELGFGSALVFAMYAPVAKGDHEKTLQLLDFYKKTYRIIAGVIALLGIGLLPFLQYIVRGADHITLFELRLYYLVFLINTVSSYFVTYKYSYLHARQKNYITTRFDTIVNFVIVIVQIGVIVVTRNYMAYLLTHCGLQVVSKIMVAVYLNNKFAILKEHPETPLAEEERRFIFREVKALAVHQFAGVAVHSTDNIIISAISGLGIVGVGLVSNYSLIISNVTGFIKIFFNQVSAGFGNLAVTDTKEAYRKVFGEMYLLSFWIFGFCSIAFFVLIPPFITLWLGGEYLIDSASLLLIVTNCYLEGQYLSYYHARVAKGNFGKDQWLAFLQAMVNLVVSIIGAKMWGLAGVYVGTVVSRLTILFTRPVFTYRFLFDRSPVEYYIYMMRYCGATALAGAITWLCTKQLLVFLSIPRFICATGMVAVIPNLLFLILFCRTKEFCDLIERGRVILKKRTS